MKRNMSIAALIATGIALSSLTACGSDDSGSGNDDTDTAITVMMASGSAVVNTIFNVADKGGHFADQGLDVELVTGQGSLDVVKQVAAGNADFGHTGVDMALVAYGQDIKTRWVTGAGAQNNFGIVVREDLGIETPADLAGETVAVTNTGGSMYAAAAAILAEAGVADEVEIRNAGDAAPGLVAQKRAAGTGTFIGYFDKSLENEGIATRLFTATEYAPFMGGDGFVVNENLLADDAETVQKFVNAIVAALEEAVADPEAVGKYNYDSAPEQFDDVEAANAGTAPVVAAFENDYTSDNGLGMIDEAGVQKMAEVLTSIGMMNEVADIGSIVNNEFVTKATD